MNLKKSIEIIDKKYPENHIELINSIIDLSLF
jgi:hypothetical protein